MIPPIANKFVAGETEATVIDHTRKLNEQGVKAILNLLGEHYDERAEADADADVYIELVDEIAAANLDACISVKPSQVGLDFGADVFRENVTRIVDHAADKGVFVWVDMEDHTTTDDTLDIFEDLARKHEGGVGLAIQANLKRTKEDLERLVDVPGKIRLVKGAYDEPKQIAYKKKEDVNQAYKDYLEFMFAEFDGGIAVGSHDPKMIDFAKELHTEYGTEFEIQMLMGVRESAQAELAKEYEMWQYVPYGDRWAQYFYRRVMERKENVLFALRAIVGR